jgi:SAM-dependent methyltransferase
MSIFSRSRSGPGYDCLAPFYDGFTEGYAYEHWFAQIEERALALGLSGGRALDLACGTGKSTAPLLARGYSVIACDISEGMIREARRKYPAQADRFQVADMRALPDFGRFDLVICLDDAINYLLTEDELQETFVSVAQALAPRGVFVFDVNSLAAYRRYFVETTVRESEGLFFAWRGEASAQLPPGETATARVEIFAQRPDGLWERRFMRHVQRHHQPGVLRAELRRAGLQCCSVVGQHPGARMDETFDEAIHPKLLYFCRPLNGATAQTA